MDEHVVCQACGISLHTGYWLGHIYFAPPASQVYHISVGIQVGIPLHMGVRVFSHLIYTMSTQLEGATTEEGY